MSKTAIAFARLYLCGVETAIAFARACRASSETAIAFAGEKWAFLVQFSAALVLLVSMVAVQGRAVVMMVPCWPASVAVEVSLVASSPRGCVLCAKKFALRTKYGPKSAVYGVLGELFRGRVAEGAVLGELFRGNAAGGPLPGELFRGPAVEGSRWTRARHLDGGCVPPLDLGRATDTRSRARHRR